MDLNEALDILNTSSFLVEFLTHSYSNMDEIFKLIKNESKLLQNAIYADAKKIILIDQKIKDKDIIELNNILERKYNIYLSITNTTSYPVYSTYNNIDLNKCLNSFFASFKIKSDLHEQIKKKIKKALLKKADTVYFNVLRINVISDKTKDIKSRRNAFYHVSDIYPEVIARTGLKTNSVALRAGMYNYNNAIFLFSESEARKLSRQKFYKGENPLRILAGDMDRGYIRGPEINYIYKVTIPDSTKIYKDPDDNHFSTAVYINENIPPENIQCIGFYIPYEWRINKEDPRYKMVKDDRYPNEHFGWYMGNGRKVEKLSTILKNNFPLKIKQLVPDSHFKKWHRNKYISKYD